MSGSFFGSMNNFRALDEWVANLNAQIANSSRIGYKATRTSFLGGVTHQDPYRSSLQTSIPENLFKRSQRVDWSQGDVVSSTSQWHAALKGQGMFAIAATLTAGTKVYYTRDGEFHKDENGMLRTKEGYYLLKKADIDLANPTNPNQVGASAFGATDFTMFSITLAQAGGDTDDFSAGTINSSLWSLTGSYAVAGGIRFDNTASNGITSKKTYSTGAGTFEVTMRFDQFPTKVSSSSDYTLGMTGGGVDAPHILIRDDNFGPISNDSDNLKEDGYYSYNNATPSGAIPIGPIAANGQTGHGAAGTRFHLFTGGSVQDGLFHTYRIDWTGTTSKWFFDGNVVAWSTMGASGAATPIQFLLGANPTNPTSFTLKSFRIVNDAPVTVGGLNSGYKVEMHKNDGSFFSSATADATGKATLNMAGLMPFPHPNAQLWIYGADGTFLGSQVMTGNGLGMQGGDQYLVNMFQFAKFPIADQVEYSTVSDTIFDAGTQLGEFYSPGIDGGPQFVTNALESANVNVQQVTPELTLAKQMYEGLTKVLQARISNLDLLMNLIR